MLHPDESCPAFSCSTLIDLYEMSVRTALQLMLDLKQTNFSRIHVSGCLQHKSEWIILCED